MLTRVPVCLFGRQRSVFSADPAFAPAPYLTFIFDRAYLIVHPIFTFIFDRASDASRPAYFSYQVLSGVLLQTVDALLTLLCAQVMVKVFVSIQSMLHPSLPRLLFINSSRTSVHMVKSCALGYSLNVVADLDLCISKRPCTSSSAGQLIYIHVLGDSL